VLLNRVHRYWVRGVLEQSLYQEARIELGMTVTVDAPHPWDVCGDQPGRFITSGAHRHHDGRGVR
jgi:hypothetical protein